MIVGNKERVRLVMVCEKLNLSQRATKGGKVRDGGGRVKCNKYRETEKQHRRGGKNLSLNEPTETEGTEEGNNRLGTGEQDGEKTKSSPHKGQAVSPNGKEVFTFQKKQSRWDYIIKKGAQRGTQKRKKAKKFDLVGRGMKWGDGKEKKGCLFKESTTKGSVARALPTTMLPNT